MYRFFFFLSLILISLFLIRCNSENQEKTSKKIISPAPNAVNKEQQKEKPSKELVKIYQLKSGMVEYVSTVQGEEVLEVMYFDDWGNRESRYTYTKDNGDLQSVSIIDDNTIYMIDDIAQKVGTKMARPKKQVVMMYEDLVKKFGDEQKARDFLKKNRITVKEEKEDILGYPCEVRVTQRGPNSSVTSWLYKGIILKAQSDMVVNGKTISTGSTATEFKPDISVSNDKFDLPQSINPRDLKDMGDLLKKSWK